MDLTDTVQGDGWNWDDFSPASGPPRPSTATCTASRRSWTTWRSSTTRTCSTPPGSAYPTADWTWSDFATAAKALTNPATKQFGVAFPADASEDTVWHFDAMLWEGGGDILNADNTQAAFNSPAGVQALTTLQQMAVTDKSMYLDLQNTKIDDLFNSGHVGMVLTGPWALSGYPDMHYGVQIMPAYPGGSHQTISGPDMWVTFDNGDARKAATLEFMQWLTDTPTGEGRTRWSAATCRPGRAWSPSPASSKAFGKKFPGEDVFAENLQNVEKARPTLQTYDQI